MTSYVRDVGKRKQGDALKKAVEQQTTRIRSLAEEVDRYADESGPFSRKSVGMMRKWADLLREIGDELTRAVNDEKNGRRRVSAVNMAAVGVVGTLAYFAPTVNNAASTLADEYLLSEIIGTKIEEVTEGARAVEEALTIESVETGEGERADYASGQGVTDKDTGEMERREGNGSAISESDHSEMDAEEPTADHLNLEVDGAMRALNLRDEEIDLAAYIESEGGPSPGALSVRPDESQPGTWLLTYPDDLGEGWTHRIQLTPGYSASDVSRAANSWLMTEVDRRAMSVAEDQYTQQVIDERRGK